MQSSETRFINQCTYTPIAIKEDAQKALIIRPFESLNLLVTIFNSPALMEILLKYIHEFQQKPEFNLPPQPSIKKIEEAVKQIWQGEVYSAVETSKAEENLDKVTYFYTAELIVGGIEGSSGPFGSGVFQGGLSIRKIYPPVNLWKRHYDVVLQSLSISPWSYSKKGKWEYGLKFGFKTSGKGSSLLEEWQPGNFLGDAILVDGSLSAAFGGGISYGISLLRVCGYRIFSPLDFDLSSLSVWGGFGAGVGVITYAMRISKSWDRGEEDDKEESGQLDRIPLNYQSSVNIYFKFGCAQIDDQQKSRIRKFCAEELIFLRSGFSWLEIISYIDRVDCERRNSELTSLRTYNILQLLNDILGKKWLFPTARLCSKAWEKCRLKNLRRKSIKNLKMRVKSLQIGFAQEKPLKLVNVSSILTSSLLMIRNVNIGGEQKFA